MESLMETLRGAVNRLLAALSGILEAVASAVAKLAHRDRSIIRRRDAVVPVDPVWPGKCYADGTPVDARVTIRPHYRIRYGDIPDRYGNYPY